MLEHFLQLHEQVQGLGEICGDMCPLAEIYTSRLQIKSFCLYILYVYIHSKLSLPNTNELVKSSLR